MKWSVEQVAFLTKHYPMKGRDWCANGMGLTTAQVRQKASRLGLKARGFSEAWFEKNRRHAELLTGRKRPEQADVMRLLHADGRLAKSEEQRKILSQRQTEWLAKNGHPRGTLGIKHNEETRRVIGEKSAEAWASRTDEQRSEILVKQMRARALNGTLVPNRIGTTWKAGWREIGGIRKYYRSKWEANYARYLEWLRVGGHIKAWAHEPTTFWFDGIKRGCVSYLPDFRVTENDGSDAYHEVKGWMDDRSKTKIKRMAKYHPSVKLVVIDSKVYADIKRKVCRMVPGWEE